MLQCSVAIGYVLEDITTIMSGDLVFAFERLSPTTHPVSLTRTIDRFTSYVIIANILLH